MTRTEITIDYVFKTDKYLNILFLIQKAETINKPLQFLHLRYALCKKHSISSSRYKENNNDYGKIEKYFKNPYKKKAIEDLKIYLPKEEHKELERRKNFTILDEFKEYTENLDVNLFESHQALGNALKRLKKLGLICTDEKYKKKGYSHYFLTPKAHYLFTHHFLKWHINRVFPKDIEISKDINKISEKDREIINKFTKFEIKMIEELNKITPF